MRRAAADLKRVADELCTEKLCAVDTVLVAQRDESSSSVVPHVAAYLAERAQSLRVPKARRDVVQLRLLADATVVSEEVDDGRLLLEGGGDHVPAFRLVFCPGHASNQFRGARGARGSGRAC